MMCFFTLCLSSFCRCFGQGRSPGATTPWHTAPVYKALLWQRPHSSTPCTPSSSSRTSFDHARCREAEVATLRISHHHHRWHLGLRLKQLMGTDSILHTRIHQWRTTRGHTAGDQGIGPPAKEPAPWHFYSVALWVNWML